MAQLQHNMTNAMGAVPSVVTGGGKWVEITVPADSLLPPKAEQRVFVCAVRARQAALHLTLPRDCRRRPMLLLAFSILKSSLRLCLSNSRSCRRSAIATTQLKYPCLSTFLLPRGAPDSRTPPCMRQRFFVAVGRRSAGFAGAGSGTTALAQKHAPGVLHGRSLFIQQWPPDDTGLPGDASFGAGE
jgi:hypothetical protein